MCSSDFVFRKYKQNSAFCVSGVLQLAKTGPPVTKNFPLNRTNLHVLTARGMSHILTRIDHSTVVDLATWPLNGSEAGGDLDLIQTSLLLLCKSSCSYAN